MSNKAAFKMSEMNDVIFRKAADKSAGVRFMSLFPGEYCGSGDEIDLGTEKGNLVLSCQVLVMLPVTRLPSEYTSSEDSRTLGTSSTDHQPNPTLPTPLAQSGER
jgi:hypothetical protein